MRLLLDEVYRLIATAKGDIAAPAKQRQAAQARYRELLDQWTEQLQGAEPGNLSITHQSVQEALERGYRDYRRHLSQAGTRRLLRD